MGASGADRPAARAPWWRLLVDLLVVLGGAGLILLTALQQPYNQNEWVQVRPYGSDLGSAVSGTRQPPLDPLLGALVQRLVGEGQLEQRLVPVVSGIATLALTAALVRRWRLGWGGTLGLLLLATAPLFVRYSAYARPYALPLTLMVGCALAGTRWLETGRRAWLVVAAVVAGLLPLARVPEPTAFLAAAALVLLLAGARRRLPRARSFALAGALLLGLALSGTATVLQLLGQASTRSGGTLVDPTGVADRLGPALDTVERSVLPLYAAWFPWWPLTLAVVALGLLLGPARRHLLGSWWWLPLVGATVLFAAAFLLLVPEGLRDYRIRFAYFLTPAVAVAGAAVAATGRGWRRVPGVVVVLALVATQLPTTWRVLTHDEAVDFERAGEVIDDRVPDDALVVLDGPGQVDRWRQGFIGEERGYLPEEAEVVTASRLTRTRLQDHADAGPVYLLVMDAACTSNVACSDRPADVWDGRLDGYRAVSRMPHLVLYAPTDGDTGLGGLLDAMTALVDGYGPAHAVPNAIVAARILDRRHRADEARDLVRRACSAQPTTSARVACLDAAERRLADAALAPEAVSWPRVRRSPA